MKTSFFFLLNALALQNGCSFVSHTQPAMRSVLYMASPETDESATKLRKRDIVKNAVKNALGQNKDTTSDDADEVSTVPSTGRKMKKIKDGKKYEKIECLEEKAYQILKDLDMLN